MLTLTNIGEALNTQRHLLIEDFISEKDRQHIYSLVIEQEMIESTIYENGEIKKDAKIRNSKSKVLFKDNDPIVKKIADKIAWLIYQEKTDNVGIDLVRYRDKGYLIEHQDPFKDGRESNREFTAIVYIRKPEGKGSTVYPNLNLIVEPIEKRLFIFKNIYNGNLDDTSIHFGEETHGEKVILVFFFNNKMPYSYNLLENR